MASSVNNFIKDAAKIFAGKLNLPVDSLSESAELVMKSMPMEAAIFQANILNKCGIFSDIDKRLYAAYVGTILAKAIYIDDKVFVLDLVLAFDENCTVGFQLEHKATWRIPIELALLQIKILQEDVDIQEYISDNRKAFDDWGSKTREFRATNKSDAAAAPKRASSEELTVKPVEHGLSELGELTQEEQKYLEVLCNSTDKPTEDILYQAINKRRKDKVTRFGGTSNDYTRASLGVISDEEFLFIIGSNQ